MLGYIAAPIALIPTFVIVGPLALLALLLPAVFGGLAFHLRKWLVFLTVLGVGSTLYLAHLWLHGALSRIGWGSPQVLWGALAVLAFAGMAWSWHRQKTASFATKTEADSTLGGTTVLWSIVLAGVATLVFTWHYLRLSGTPWTESLVLCALAWAALVSFLKGRRHHPGQRQRAAASESLMLASLAAVCAAVAILPTPSAIAHAGPAAGPRVLWSFEPIERGAIVSSPVVDGDRVYTAVIRDFGGTTSGAVYCLRCENRETVWRFDDGGALQHMYSTPCLADGRLYIGEGMHANLQSKFYCLDATSGRKLWGFQTSSHIESSPCVANGCVFFGAGDDGIYCLDAATGVKRWQAPQAVHVDSSPVVGGDRLYAGAGVSRRYREPAIFCLDSHTGKTLWRQVMDLPAWGSPAVDGSQVFFGLGNGRLVRGPNRAEQPAGALLCVDAVSGKTTWRFNVGDAVFARPALDAARAYFGARDGCCYAVSRHDGRLCWKQPLGSPVMARPALLDGSLYVAATAGQVARLDSATGRIVWSFDLAGYSQSTPRLLASPAALTLPDARLRRIYVAAELQNPVSSAALLLCLEEPASDPREAP